MTTTHAYLINGAYLFVESFPCTVEGLESWPDHPWTITDPTLPTYQDCPRCGARRIIIGSALANAAARANLPAPP